MSICARTNISRAAHSPRRRRVFVTLSAGEGSLFLSLVSSQFECCLRASSDCCTGAPLPPTATEKRSDAASCALGFPECACAARPVALCACVEAKVRLTISCCGCCEAAAAVLAALAALFARANNPHGRRRRRKSRGRRCRRLVAGARNQVDLSPASLGAPQRRETRAKPKWLLKAIGRKPKQWHRAN